MGLGAGGVTGSWAAPHAWDECPYKRDPREPRRPCTTGGHKEKWVAHEGEEPAPAAERADALILQLPASRRVTHKCLWLEYSVTAAWTDGDKWYC